MKRTRVNLSNTHLTTCEMGKLIPFEWYDCLPNDIAKISCNITMKAQPMIAPLMHRINMLTQYYFVPYRILWEDWAEFITGGEDGTASPTYPTMTTYSGSGATINSLENYIGLPANQEEIKYGALPIRAYNKIWNDHYKVDDIDQELEISLQGGDDNITNRELLSCNWARDRFTRAKPFTQRGEQINVPIYTTNKENKEITQLYAIYKPTITTQAITKNDPSSAYKKLGTCVYNQVLQEETKDYDYVFAPQNLALGNTYIQNEDISPTTATNGYIEIIPSDTIESINKTYNFTAGTCSNVNPKLYAIVIINWGEPISFSNSPINTLKMKLKKASISSCQGDVSQPWGARLKYSYFNESSKFDFEVTQGISIKNTTQATGGAFLNIRDLRVASALQRYQEKSLKYGAEYEDYCKMEFNCKPRDSRLQKSEYLGGSQGILQISEVIQTSDSNETALGNQAGYGVGKVQQKRIRYRCPEHGIIIGLLSIRPETIYTQGLDRALLKRERFDYWTREFVGIGAQEIYQQEIYADKDNEKKLFGYDLNGNYREYYSKRSRVSGNFETNLNFWHLARFFNHPPVLNKSFLEMKPDKRPFAIVDRTLPAFLCYIQNSAIFYRPIPRKVKNILK